MPNRAEFLVLLVALGVLAGCPQATEPQPIEAPEAIGTQLRQVEGIWTQAACSSSRLYWDGQQVQHQCFDADGAFSWQNRGVLTEAAADALAMELASADLDATEPVNYEGGCAAADSQGKVTLWVDGETVEFAPDCIFEGIVSLYAQLQAIGLELSSCDPVTQLASVEPGCRAY